MKKLPATIPVSAHWAAQPERSTLAMMRLMAFLSLRLGRPATRLLLHGIAAYYLVFASEARRASARFLGRVFGRRATLGAIYRQIHTFATTIHDRVFFLCDRFELFDLEVVGEQELRVAAAAGRGIVLFGAHLGSFEVLRALARQRGDLRVTMLMYEDNARKINALFSGINADLAAEMIALGHMDSMLRVADTLDAGHYVGILADRDLGPGGLVVSNFLGAPARFPMGPFRMAALLRRPAFFMTGLYLGGNRYRIHFAPLADFDAASSMERDALIESASERYVQLLEHYCRMAPSNWFNFYDFWDMTP